jgi:hypothetical protein
MQGAALGLLCPAGQDRAQDFFEALRFGQSLFEVVGDEAFELFRPDRAPLAANFALPGLGRACVVAVSPTLPGAQRNLAMPREAQKQMPLGMVGPLTTRGAESAGSRILSKA